MAEIAARSDEGCEVAVTSVAGLFKAWQVLFSLAGVQASVLLPLAGTGFAALLTALSSRTIRIDVRGGSFLTRTLPWCNFLERC